MGVVENISHDKFPKQSSNIGKRIHVTYNYENKYVNGIIVRDDKEHPFQTIFKLDDGRYVRAVECQYAFGEAP